MTCPFQSGLANPGKALATFVPTRNHTSATPRSVMRLAFAFSVLERADSGFLKALSWARWLAAPPSGAAEWCKNKHLLHLTRVLRGPVTPGCGVCVWCVCVCVCVRGGETGRARARL